MPGQLKIKKGAGRQARGINAEIAVDIGNSSTVAGLLCDGHPRRVVRMPTSATSHAAACALLRKLTGRRPPAGAALCSVVPRATAIWRKALREFTGKTPVIIGHRLGLNVRLDGYPRPGTIGPDRLANICAARHMAGAPVIVIDCGTATTVDAVDRAGIFRGGVIVPGAALFLDYLAERTALLPRLRLPARRRPEAWGRNTRAAMLIGAQRGYAGMLREILSAQQAALGERRVALLITGGYAQRIAGTVGPEAVVDRHLTLRGIALIMAINSVFKKRKTQTTILSGD